MSYAAVVLAAGHARRFGADKLARDFDGAPLVLHAISAAQASPARRIVMVKRPGSALEAIYKDVAGRDGRIEAVEIESEALSASLRAGLQAVRGASGVFIFLGDMPLIPRRVAGELASRLGESFAAVPAFKGRWGHPVLLSARAARLAEGLVGDQGAGPLLRQHETDITSLEVADEGVLLDIDTLEDHRRLSGRMAPD